jgi:hypothetical protein
MATRNSEVLASFVEYCQKNPQERFWQALRNWTGYNFIYVSNVPPYSFSEEVIKDTFYWEGQNS